MLSLGLVIQGCKKEHSGNETGNFQSQNDHNIFSNIEKVRTLLSSVGIGNLSEWKDDQMGGIVSVSTYYQFESINNLSFYLEGSNSSSIDSIKLALNINDPTKRKSALTMLGDTTKKMLGALNLSPPDGLINDIEAGVAKQYIVNDVKIEVELVKSKIENWTVKLSPI